VVGSNSQQNFPQATGNELWMMPGDLLPVAEPDYLGTLAGRDEQKLCGKWMPRKKTTCARTSGHGGDCKTAELMERQRAYRRSHPHRQASESHKKSNRKARIANYGLTLEDFDRLLKQGAAVRLRHVSRPVQRGAAHPCGPRPRMLQGQVPLMREVRPRTPVSCLQYCTWPHRAPLRTFPPVPGEPSRPTRREGPQRRVTTLQDVN
jgi:hypothetical protein